MSTVGRPQFGSDPFAYLKDLEKANERRITQSHQEEGHSPRTAQRMTDDFVRETEQAERNEAIDRSEGSPPREVQLRQTARDLASRDNPLRQMAPGFVATAQQDIARELERERREAPSSSTATRNYRDRTDESRPERERSPFAQDGADNATGRDRTNRNRSRSPRRDNTGR